MAYANEHLGMIRRTLFMFRAAGVYDRDAYVYTIAAEGIRVSDANAPSTELGSAMWLLPRRDR